MSVFRIAMWPGPRNLSTALMRSFSSRPDTAVSDEPFYGYYLKQTGIQHPGRDEIMAAYPTAWRDVVSFISGPVPGGKPVWYQKHMAHHMVGDVDVDLMVKGLGLTHAFLIRDPADVITSYTKVHPSMTLAETGLPYQVELFERIQKHTGRTPPVVESKDILLEPKGTLARLCEVVGVEFTPAMLQWAAGPHPSDGNWAPHWYGAIYKSTTFEPYKAKNEAVRPELECLLVEAQSLYNELAAHKL